MSTECSPIKEASVRVELDVLERALESLGKAIDGLVGRLSFVSTQHSVSSSPIAELPKKEVECELANNIKTKRERIDTFTKDINRTLEELEI